MTGGFKSAEEGRGSQCGSNTLNTEANWLAAFHPHQNDIIQFFLDNPIMAEKPYDIEIAQAVMKLNGINKNIRSLVAPLSNAHNHPIWLKANSLGICDDDRVAVLDDENWRYLFSEFKIIYANDLKTRLHSWTLVDTFIYVGWLISFYRTHIEVFKNVYSTNVSFNAIGQIQTAAAQKAITRFVAKHITDFKLGGVTSIYWKTMSAIHSHHIVEWMRLDMISMAVEKPKGLQFEIECRDILVANGFDTSFTPGSGDFGADLIARKDDLSWAIQCKDHARPVGIKSVQEAVSARKYYKTDYAVVCSRNGFTLAAVELASTSETLLCSHNNLISRL